MSRDANKVTSEARKLSQEVRDLCNEADEVSQEDNESSQAGHPDAIKQVQREALVARQRARDAYRQAADLHLRAQKAHQYAQAAHQGAAQESAGQASLNHQQAEQEHQQAQRRHRGIRKDHEWHEEFQQSSLKAQQARYGVLEQVIALANDQSHGHDERRPNAEATHEIAREIVMQVEEPQADLERRPGCLCQECFLPPVDERDNYHIQVSYSSFTFEDRVCTRNNS